MEALYIVFYNWTRIRKTLRITPAMAAGLTGLLMSMEDIAQLVEDAAPNPRKCGHYRKKGA